MNDSKYLQAYTKYRLDLKAAVEFEDPNWTHSAITRERVRRRNTALEALTKVIPAATEGEGADPRAAALEQLRVVDANTVAVSANEWAKVERLLAAGRTINTLVEQADLRRLTAILDQFPTSTVAIESGDADVLAREVEGLVFDRLVGLGDEKATRAAEAAKVTAHQDAWAQVLTEATRGDVSIGAWSALYRVAPDEYETSFEASTADLETTAKLRNLDQLASRVEV